MSGAREVIGKVEWGDVVAELVSVDEWRVTRGGVADPALAASLSARYRGEFRGPSDGIPGGAILQDLASRTGGLMTFDPPPPKNPGLIY